MVRCRVLLLQARDGECDGNGIVFVVVVVQKKEKDV